MINLNSTSFKESKIALLASTLFFLLSLLIAFSYEGTGDSGDSISHFLYAQYAFQHPENFFYQWAKPLFVLFAAPFSQFGFVGIKVFNCLNASLTLYFTYKIAKKLEVPKALLVILILATCSMYFTLIFSGLTEHFSALLLVISIHFYLNEKYIPATILISFLPFARSEGLLIIGITALYLISKKRYQYLMLLPVGHIAYSIAGYIIHKDFLWVFNKISYISMSAYGHGAWYHFIELLYYSTGLPQYILFFIGIFYFFSLLFKKAPPQYQERIWLIYGYFFVLLIAHSLFWYLGIFNSYGLARVMNMVMPMFSIIVLLGYNYFTNFIQNVLLKKWTQSLLIVAFIFMPFTNNPAAIFFPKDFVKQPDQVLLSEAAPYINEHFEGYCIFYSNPCVFFYLNIDPFDSNQSQMLYKINEVPIPPKSVLIWDNLFSVIDHGFTLEKLQIDERFEEVKQFEDKVHNKRFVVFKMK